MAKETLRKDVIVIGAGMAGLTAAMYVGRMNFEVLVLENGIVGGQIANAVGIENCLNTLPRKILDWKILDWKTLENFFCD